MNNGFRDKLIKFMEGRYGVDELFCILTGAYLLLVFVNMPLHSLILFIASTGLLVYTMWRSLSKNIEKRRLENDRVMDRVRKLRANSERNKRIKEQSGEYYFKKCPGCKKMLRLPRVGGKHNTTCPACGKTFSVNIKEVKGK